MSRSRRARLTTPLLAGLAAGVLAVAAVVVAVAVHARAESDTETAAAAPPTPSRDVGWIAYSTAPADNQRRRSGYPGGSDIYVARAGSQPRLVAGRGDGTTWNVCPAFSPDGRFLAFGTKSPEGRAVRIVGVAWDGTVFRAPVYTPKPDGFRKSVATPLTLEQGGDAPCPRWSADGQRVAYVDNGRVVVRRLNGSFARRGAGDPAQRDFRRRSSYEVLSPAGDRVARLNGGIVVSGLDRGAPGSAPRNLGVEPLGTYALAGWSPAGDTLLVMRDIDGLHFTMLAVPVDAPGKAVPVAVAVPVNHARSWPRRGDVSWRS